ncbi:consortin isoform X2 [Narcine bancroftii]|uniref:consortin isoform X2 n=1 Tax=Narcine bancroftii TaxID=1343680 RepID=UPI003831DA9C
MDEGELLKIERETTDKVCNECVGNSTSLTSDENKNQICEAQLVSACNDEIMGGSEQDLINNNEGNCGETDFEMTQSDCIETDCNVKKEVSKNIANPNAKLLQEKEMICSVLKATSSDGLSKPLHTVVCLGSDEIRANCQQVDRDGLLQALFNCVQKATELNDCSTLPHLLHQIAEVYFDEEEYEKAIQFIQLEKLYHQKLLTNLAAIQECWEMKLEAAKARKTVQRGTVQSLDNDKIRSLTEICASHCSPNLPGGKEEDACKDITTENNSSLTAQRLGAPRVQTVNCDYASLEMMEDRIEDSTEPLQVAVTIGECCARDSAMYAAEPSVEGEVEAVKARMHFNVATEHLYLENIKTDESCFQPHVTMPGKDNLTAKKTIKTESFSDVTQVVLNAVPFFHEEIESLQHSLKFVGKTTEENGQLSLKCNKTLQFNINSEAISKHSNHVSQKHAGNNSNDCINGGTWSVRSTSHSEETVEIAGRTTKQTHTNLLSAMSEEHQKIDSEVEQEIQFSEFQMSDEILEQQGDENEEEVSCFKHNAVSSSQKNDTEELMQFGDNSLSLDELAKRIQIEESIHAEGLVSILKKGSSNKTVTQARQKRSKRRVRFQDPQDMLDQEEGNGDSCLLLVLLCIVTVLLSILGTALYCTFGDLESTVCRDFTTQMDFYSTQFQQGFEKVKQWLLFS